MLVLSDRTPATVDIPRDLTLARWLHEGYWPQWNPLSAAGAPLWAEQTGPLFPLRLPLYLFPSLAAHKLFLCLRLIAAGLGAYLLARYRKLLHWPAIGAGIAFELSGALVEGFPFSASSAQCMLPWVLLGAAAIARRRDGRAAVGAIVALAITANSGHPTVILIVFLAFAAATAGHVASAWRQPRAAGTIAVWSAATGVLALGLGAPTLLPLAELTLHAQAYKYRPAGGIAWAQALAQSRASVAPALLAPHVLQSLRQELNVIHAAAAALGVGPLLLALAGLLGGGLDAALLLVGGLGVVLATAPPGLSWIYDLPGMRLILPFYVWMLVALPLTQAAGAALQQSGTAAGRRRLVLAIGLAAVAIPSLATVPNVLWAPFSLVAEAAFHSGSGALLLGLPFVVAALAMAACYALARVRMTHWGPALIAALALTELLLLWAPFLRQPTSHVLSGTPSPAIAFLKQHLASRDGRFVAIPPTAGHPLSSMYFGLADLRGFYALPLSRFVDYLDSINGLGNGSPLQGIWVLRSPLLDLAAVRYMATIATGPAAPPLLADDPRLPLVHADQWIRIYQNTAALPRVRIVHQALHVADQAAARHAVRAAARRSAHAADTAFAAGVFVEPDAAGRFPPSVTPPDANDEAVRIVDDSDPDRLLIEARLASPGLVVIADTFYPGWRAWVDGVETPIHPANLLFRAVHVPPGAHAIELRYEPLSFRAGLAVGAVAALICLVLFRRSRRVDVPGSG